MSGIAGALGGIATGGVGSFLGPIISTVLGAALQPDPPSAPAPIAPPPAPEPAPVVEAPEPVEEPTKVATPQSELDAQAAQTAQARAAKRRANVKSDRRIARLSDEDDQEIQLTRTLLGD